MLPDEATRIIISLQVMGESDLELGAEFGD